MQKKRKGSQALAMYQAAALQSRRDGEARAMLSEEDAALLLQQHHGALSGANGELKITRDLIECLAMAQGMHDGLAGLGVDSASYEYVANRHYIRSFCNSIPIPFTAFDGIRSSRHSVKLTPAQQENVMKSFEKIMKAADGKPSSASKIAKEMTAPLPFVSAFFDQRCPELRSGVLNHSRCGTTYLLLSVITGFTELCALCLEAGANPNSVNFLRDKNPPANEMFHGYSPVFMAVLAEQLEILELLYQHGGSIRICDRWGRTPLHAAVALNSKEIAQWLHNKGAPRYIGDCLNLTPAEGADEEYYPMLAMPNLALQGFPKDRHKSVFLAPPSPAMRDASAGPTLAASSTPTKADETAVHATSSGRRDGKEDVPYTENVAAGAVVRNAAGSCHCHSGRLSGACGCVDDMFLRWTADRLATTWSAGVDYYALATRQKPEETKGRQGVAAGNVTLTAAAGDR